jgi:hypothetical protein
MTTNIRRVKSQVAAGVAREARAARLASNGADLAGSAPTVTVTGNFGLTLPVVAQLRKYAGTWLLEGSQRCRSYQSPRPTAH